jgi:adenylate kinase
MKVIIVTGTPCTGKTTYAKKMAEERKYRYIDVGSFIKENKLEESYDKKRKSYVVDEKRLADKLAGLIGHERKAGEKGIVIDSHLSHFIDRKYVDLCIVTKCNLKELKKRLEKRGYSKAKVEENLQAEIFDICLEEAREKGHNIKTVDTSK